MGSAIRNPNLRSEPYKPSPRRDLATRRSLASVLKTGEKWVVFLQFVNREILGSSSVDLEARKDNRLKIRNPNYAKVLLDSYQNQ